MHAVARIQDLSERVLQYVCMCVWGGGGGGRGVRSASGQIRKVRGGGGGGGGSGAVHTAAEGVLKSSRGLVSYSV